MKKPNKIKRYLKIIAMLPLIPIIGIPGDPPADPSPTDAPIDPPPAAPPTDEADIEELRRQLEDEKAGRESDLKARQKAELALEAERKKTAEYNKERRSQMTAAEELAEREKEIAEREQTIQRRDNRSAAREALAGLGLTDKEMTADELELFVRTDSAETVAICQYVVSLVKRREDSAAKAEREKVLREMPTPPSGGDSGDIQPKDLTEALTQHYRK